MLTQDQKLKLVQDFTKNFKHTFVLAWDDDANNPKQSDMTGHINSDLMSLASAFAGVIHDNPMVKMAITLAMMSPNTVVPGSKVDVPTPAAATAAAPPAG